MRLAAANAEPRTAGVGNCVNCGVAMWMMPAGAVNAGDPCAAYQEAVLVGSAHNESFAVEAGAVMAACYAEAFAPEAQAEAVVGVATGLARDGTRAAVQAACAAADPGDGLTDFVARVRAAVAPYDQREGHTPDDKPLALARSGDLGRPSRTASIEELPVALAALRYGAGDVLKTLRAAVCYGRDCDSIAGMASGLFGALFGRDAIPPPLRAAVDKANKRDFGEMAGTFLQAVQAIAKRDEERWTRRARALGIARAGTR
jgi:ADP-ribosylglycohydrolase